VYNEKSSSAEAERVRTVVDSDVGAANGELRLRRRKVCVHMGVGLVLNVEGGGRSGEVF
jgi:hypothetical protein